MNYKITYSDEYLAHHGILGQKWGIRRFQNEDGTYTAAGRERYGIGDLKEHLHEKLEARKKYKKGLEDLQKKSSNAAMEYNMSGSKESLKKYKKSLVDVEAYKDKYKDSKIEAKLAKEKDKSKHRLKLEEEYKKKGMNDKEAAIAAYRRERLQKVLIAAGAVAVTAAAVYGVKKYREYNLDKIVPEGTTVATVTAYKDAPLKDAFYATFEDNKYDTDLYRGAFAQEVMRREGKYSVYVKAVSATADMKMASPKSGVNELRKMCESDPQYAKELKNYIRDFRDKTYSRGYGFFPAQDKEYKLAMKALENGKIDRHVYNAFNHALVDPSVGKGTVDKFYSQMRNAGYDMIIDINDKKMSAMHAKSPVIIFDKSRLGYTEVTPLTTEEISTRYSRILATKVSEALAASAAKNTAIAGVASGAAYGTTKYARHVSDDRIVQNYRNEHPNTKLSYHEILRMERSGANK